MVILDYCVNSSSSSQSVILAKIYICQMVNYHAKITYVSQTFL